MLRIIQNNHAAGAKGYYSTADYYSEGQELEGNWKGRTAAMLGLSGRVGKEQWDMLCDNIHPATGNALTLRNKTDRTVGYDFNFHVPKSVSLLYAATRDESILDAFRTSVNDTMKEIEQEMQVRVRKEGKNENRQTGNMVWGEFTHFTARPVAGLPDPHLHAHCFVFNTTWDSKEQVFKAGQFRDLKRDAPYFEAVFHSRLGHRLHELGLPIERTKKGWELQGLSTELLAKFSRRTTQIEDLAREKGIDDAETKSELGAKTRNRKQKDLTLSELQAEWLGRMTDTEREQLSTLERRIGSVPEPVNEHAAHQAVEYATLHSFERQSVVPERKLLAAALKHGVGQTQVADVLDMAARSSLIHGTMNGRTMVTTPTVLAEEQKFITFAKNGRGACRPIGQHRKQFNRDWLNMQQKAAVTNILESRDRLIVLRGAAGVGKTTLMQEAVEAIQENGEQILAFAPSADASRGVLREAGFTDAETVARLLVDQELQQAAAGHVIWIDEAGLLGSKTLSQVVELAEKIDARILLTGDRKQHASVERGSPLALLEREAGIVPVEVKEIKRQQGDYKQAVKLLSEQKTKQGFEQLDRLGWIKEVDFENRYHLMAADYVAATAKGQTALVVSPTHREGDRINEEIRTKLRASAAIGKEEHEFATLQNAGLTEAERGDRVNYATGDVIVFQQNAKGFRRGARVVTVPSQELPLNQANKFQVFHSQSLKLSKGDRIRITNNGTTKEGKHRLNNGAMYTVKAFTPEGDIVLRENGWTVAKDFGHITHGYVVTSHASQGKSVDRVFIGQSSESFRASSQEQFYVSVSRGAKQATIYTNDKHALKEAVTQNEERISAMDLIKLNRYFETRERTHEQQPTQTLELAHER
jgi:conjugative relaxase-like TrwC/TraI family protein